VAELSEAINLDEIESPSGDLMRDYGVIHNDMSSSFPSCNRNKRSLALDLKRPEALEIVHKLVGTADVPVQNFRPGAIERIGLGESAVRAIRPDIVFVWISGVGESGPYAHQRIYDPVIQALCAAGLDVTPASDRRMAPFLGEHNGESEAGKLASSGVLAARRAA
jgi:crotonobetainyl-CoA:carnitine CoA-transferase CaiB-like acyl-CoA transferase